MVHADWLVVLCCAEFHRIFLLCSLHLHYCLSPAGTKGQLDHLPVSSSCSAESARHEDLKNNTILYTCTCRTLHMCCVSTLAYYIPLTSSFNLWHISLSRCFSSSSFSRITFLSNAYGGSTTHTHTHTHTCSPFNRQ